MQYLPALTTAQLPDSIVQITGPILTSRKAAGGATASVLLIESRHGRYAIKRAHQAPFGDWLRREYEVLAALASTGLPVPHAHLYLEQPLGVHWMVMDQLPGQPLRRMLPGAARPRHALLEQYGRLLAQVHSCPLPDALRADPHPWLDHMLARAADALEHYFVDGNAALLQRLTTWRPAAIAPALIHGDATCDNILVDGATISGLIDWSGGAWGDPRYDLALATQPSGRAFRSRADHAAFWQGYGTAALSAAEQQYFLDLYEFF